MAPTVTSARVDTETDGTLMVRWELAGEAGAVDIATGPTPDQVDHVHETTVPAGQTSWWLDPPAAGRLFVSVAPHGSGPAVVVTDRRISFEGITNFRDLGGYRTRLDAVVRWGLVFRADALHGLSTADRVLYDQLGLRAVYDLRGEVERDERPNPVPSRPLTIIGRPPDAEPPPVPRTGLTAADGEGFLRDMYVGLINHAAPQIGQLFTGLTQEDGLPAVFHCHAGKDRTGVVAALLLEVLGVERGAVLDDYELTGRYRLRSQQESTFTRLLESGLSPEAAAGVLTTPRWAMEEALDHLDAEHGGVEEYLTGPAGMRKEDLETLRTRLLDPGA